MARAKSAKATIIKRDRFAALLEDEPAERTKRIYTAIIFSLVLHIFVFIIMLLVVVGPPREVEATTPLFEELDLNFLELMQPANAAAPNATAMSEDVRNLLANENEQRTAQRVSYTGKSRAAMEQEVEEYYRNLEKSEYEKLAENHKEYIQPDANDKTVLPRQRDDYSHLKNNEKSYEGTVTKSFSLPGRDATATPTPAYRCKASGKVIVKIEVSATGEVTSAVIDEAQSTLNLCLRDESRNYAQRWKFNYKADAPKKQSGTITFVFAAQ